MRAIEMRRYAMLVRVRQFGEAHRDLFPESTLARQTFATVAATVAALSGHAVSKMSTRGEGRGAKAAAREALVARLEAMVRTARVIGDEAPGIHDYFRLPARLTDHAVLTAGRVFAHKAEEFAGQFIAHGIPATFLADLNDLMEKFEQAISVHEAGRSGQAVARAGIAASLSAGFAAVSRLDVIVANQLHADPVTLAVWDCDRRVGYPKKRPRRSSGTAIARLARTA